MHRTQLYIEQDVWAVLQKKAQLEGTTVSELVRVAVRDRYLPAAESRRLAMEAFAGSGAGTHGVADTDAYIRDLRRGTRLSRLEE